ncbi:hypothetical protein ACMX25_22235 [Caballeronia sp. 15715]|uniref:hypothetical protein n=1 Tax=Caballeronia sp. 15715 TaxID=3391030 RepID=UPI0039E40909
MTKIPKCTFYQNLPVKRYLDSWLQEINLSRAQKTAPPQLATQTASREKSAPTFDEERGSRRTERELHHANQLIAVLTADNHDLRERVADLEMDAARIDFSLATGFRV